MFTLFKRRDFGDYVSDTFQFFRQTGKHYFQNYFIISGFMLIFLVAVTYFLFNVYFEAVSKIGIKEEFKNPLFENIPLLILGGIFMFIFMILLHMLHFAIPVIYMDLYDKKNGDDFDFKDILTIFKSRFGKILNYFLGLTFIILPLIVLVFGSLIYLSVTFIGIPITIVLCIPIFLFVLPTLYCWTTLGFFEYLNENKGFWQALSAGFRHIKNQYFPIVCSAMIIYIIIYIAMTIFTMIPYIIEMVSYLSRVNPTNENPMGAMGPMMTIVMVISMLTSFILNNLLLVNQGLVYYSRKECDGNVSSNYSIDLIGSE